MWPADDIFVLPGIITSLCLDTVSASIGVVHLLLPAQVPGTHWVMIYVIPRLALTVSEICTRPATQSQRPRADVDWTRVKMMVNDLFIDLLVHRCHFGRIRDVLNLMMWIKRPDMQRVELISITLSLTVIYLLSTIIKSIIKHHAQLMSWTARQHCSTYNCPITNYKKKRIKPTRQISI